MKEPNDTLTEILESLTMRASGDAWIADRDKRAIAEAHTQILQYIEGIIGEDEEADWVDSTPSDFEGRNDLRAEQRKRLQGKQ